MKCAPILNTTIGGWVQVLFFFQPKFLLQSLHAEEGEIMDYKRCVHKFAEIKFILTVKKKKGRKKLISFFFRPKLHICFPVLICKTNPLYYVSLKL